MPRHAALAILSRWDPRRNNLEDLLPATLPKLDTRDAALTRHLVEESVRRLNLLDHWIDRLSSSRNLEDEVRNVLRIGLVQLRFSRIPVHAALDTTTGLAPSRAKGFVNALMRRASREPEHLDAWERSAPPATRFSITPTLWAHWCRHYGEAEATLMAAATLAPAPLFFRPNTFSPRHREAIGTDDVRPVDGHPGFFRSTNPLPTAWFDAGMIAVQDPAAAMATDLLAPVAGETILDACASPGGKSRQLAEMAAGRARIIATDLPGRMARLQDNLRRWQVPGVDCRIADWANPLGPWPEFDAILVDAPCTNTGVLRRRLDARHRFSEATLAHAVSVQAMILDATAALLKPGGRMVYSTCSMEPEENSRQVEAFLARHPGWRMLQAKQIIQRAGDEDGHFAALLHSPA